MDITAANTKRYVVDPGDKFSAQILRKKMSMRYSHIHPVFELYFCPESVQQRTVVCGTAIEIDHPTVILWKPYTIHSIASLQKEKRDQRNYVFSFNEKIAEELGIDLFPNDIFKEKMGLVFRLNEADAAYLEALVQFFFDGEHPLDESEQLLLFSFFLRKMYGFTKDDGITGVGSASSFVQEVLKYIGEHFTENLDSAFLAAHFSVSRSKLDRDFKSALGETPKALIESCRLHYAKKLLVQNKDIKIAELSELCGFTSENYFYRFFRNHMGMTPSDYKKHYKDG